MEIFMKQLTVAEKQWVKEYVGKMTLSEKISQTICEHVTHILEDEEFMHITDVKEKIQTYIDKYNVGNIFISGEIIKGPTGDGKETKEIIELLQKNAKIPMLVAGDIEFGVGSVVRNQTSFPSNMTLATIDDLNVAYNVGRCVGMEAKAIGFNWCFGPVVDLYNDWMAGGSSRNISDEPDTVIKVANEIIRGMNDENLVATAKHFPGITGDLNSHLTASGCECSEEEWYNTYGKIYEELTKNHVESIMIAHVYLKWAEEFNEEENGYCPATLSRKAVQGILRDKIGFDGVAVTDAVNMSAFVLWKNYKQRMIDLINSGQDVALWPGKEYEDVITDAVKRGEIKEETLDKCVERILSLKIKCGILDITKSDLKGEQKAYDMEAITKEAEELNKMVCKNSVTCVRNLDKQLPLDSDKVKNVLVLKLERIGSPYSPCNRFISKLKERGCVIDEYCPDDFNDWTKKVQMIKDEKAGKRWDAYFILYNHSSIGNHRPVGDFALSLWRTSAIETVKPILISFDTPFLLYDLPHIKTFITTFGSGSKTIVEQLVRDIFGEDEFNYKVPVKFIEPKR